MSAPRSQFMRDDMHQDEVSEKVTGDIHHFEEMMSYQVE